MARIDLTGKPIVITGASSGIGEATALACARAGMPVVVGARRLDRLESLVTRIRSEGGKAVAMVCDVNKPEDCAALVARCVEEFGSIYAVYANAGYGLEATALETTDDEYRQIFETNFFGSLNVIRPAVERMRAARAPGHVLLCSSCLGRGTVPFSAAYSASKAMQAHIGCAMRYELEPEKIRVSIVCPIGTKTEFGKSMHIPNQRAAAVEHTPDWLKQMPEYVADKTVQCLRRPRMEVWTGPRGNFVRFGMAVLTFAPWLGNWTMRRMVRRREAALRAGGVR